MPIVSADYISTYYNRIDGLVHNGSTNSAGTESSSTASIGAVEDIVTFAGQPNSAASNQPIYSRTNEQFGEIEETKTDNQGDELDSADQAVLTKLELRDRQVRTHEQAHLATAGRYANGGASFTYQRGPDGRLYAVGGEVSIDISVESTPEETIRKMQVVKQAALAPSDPSATDRQVAAQANVRLTQAQHEMSAAQSNQESSTHAGPAALTRLSNEQGLSSSSGMRYQRSLMADTYRAINELF